MILLGKVGSAFLNGNIARQVTENIHSHWLFIQFIRGGAHQQGPGGAGSTRSRRLRRAPLREPLSARPEWAWVVPPEPTAQAATSRFLSLGASSGGGSCVSVGCLRRPVTCPVGVPSASPLPSPPQQEVPQQRRGGPPPLGSVGAVGQEAPGTSGEELCCVAVGSRLEGSFPRTEVLAISVPFPSLHPPHPHGARRRALPPTGLVFDNVLLLAEQCDVVIRMHHNVINLVR